MMTVETIGRIRRAYFVERQAIREISRDLRVSRRTVRKAVRQRGPDFRYERTMQPRPRLGAFVERLDDLLAENVKRPRRAADGTAVVRAIASGGLRRRLR